MTTFIDTNQCKRVKSQELQGEYAEIINKQLCGANNVLGMLRWLNDGQKFIADRLKDTYQVLYVLNGNAAVILNGKEYNIKTGMGIFLESDETTSISPSGNGAVKLLHLVVPKLQA